MIYVSVKCIHCGKEYKILMSKDQYTRIINRYQIGEHIQDILPEVSADIRELFISQICPICWDNMFKGNDEEDEY